MNDTAAATEWQGQLDQDGTRKLTERDLAELEAELDKFQADELAAAKERIAVLERDREVLISALAQYMARDVLAGALERARREAAATVSP
jgi:hypothetical protein